MTEPIEPTEPTRTTVSLTPRPQAALQRIMARRQVSKTDAVAWALTVADVLDQLLDERGSLRIVDQDGSAERIYLL